MSNSDKWAVSVKLSGEDEETTFFASYILAEKFCRNVWSKHLQLPPKYIRVSIVFVG